MCISWSSFVKDRTGTGSSELACTDGDMSRPSYYLEACAPAASPVPAARLSRVMNHRRELEASSRRIELQLMLSSSSVASDTPSLEFLRKWRGFIAWRCWRCAGEGSKPSPAGVGEIGLHLAMARAYALLEQPHSDRRAWRVCEGGERGGGQGTCRASLPAAGHDAWWQQW